MRFRKRLLAFRSRFATFCPYDKYVKVEQSRNWRFEYDKDGQLNRSTKAQSSGGITSVNAGSLRGIKMVRY